MRTLELAFRERSKRMYPNILKISKRVIAKILFVRKERTQLEICVMTFVPNGAGLSRKQLIESREENSERFLLFVSRKNQESSTEKIKHL